MKPEIGEGDQRPEMVERTRHLGAAEQAEDRPGPACVIEFQRHPRDHQEQEAGHHEQVQEALERREAGEELAVGVDLRLGLPERLRVVQVEIHRAHQPEKGVDAEHREHPHQQRGHEKEHPVEQRIVGPVERVGVRLVLRELRPDAGMALPAGADDAPRGQARARIADREHVVVPVAVVAGRDGGRDVGPAQRHRLAVVRLVVVREAVFMAPPATAVARRLEAGSRRRLDLVGGVAVGAHRPARVALLQKLPVHALVVDLLDAQMARAAGLRDARVGGPRVAVDAPLDVVHAVAVVAGRRDHEAHLRERAAVDAVAVLARHLGETDPVFGRSARGCRGTPRTSAAG